MLACCIRTPYVFMGVHPEDIGHLVSPHMRGLPAARTQRVVFPRRRGD